MKNYFLGMLAGSVLLTSLIGCDANKKEVEKLKREKDSLMYQINTKDSVVNTYVGSFNEIEENLATIKQKESILSSNRKGTELSDNAKDRINEDIQTINKLMDENREKIATLNEQMRKSGHKVASLEKMIRNLNNKLAEKDKELAGLRDQLQTLNATIETLHTSMDTLTAQSTGKSKVITEQTTKLNTAYYAVGTYKELKEKKVLNKEGGFLGLGKEEVLKKDFNTEYFTQIDILKTTTIVVGNKKAKLLTTHPSDSYKMNMADKKKVTDITITNPEKFWKVSKYMVVVID
jgi:DNA repair exonuclease SbcCD ATPase subunit